ncbi:tetratricopeptide repeat protein [Bernardetia litoralis DSM 6794]|uniref:Tetratricopeptide repeat protein n=1 Tax=Bernardetia litoralis (strain ATCC 23117 / DSM 6794 / NBRC 15988 / NCIMB 1366 / Fx l1 / Sio-4) TaxID=880071 RepID=I4AFP4_BERLS|nr:tetratricopeptide repeat protein [Bernardetia litoralis]AFM02779.1 tetratricopeptide repeat protein [Bernardetia litoralis DSM 6794]
MKNTYKYYIKSFGALWLDEEEEYEELISELKEKLKLEKNSNGYNNLGLAQLEMGYREESLINLNQAIKLNPSNSIAYYNRAELNKKLKKNVEAEIDYSKAIELEPSKATYWRCRAYLRKERTGDLINALTDFKQAEKIEPEFQPTKDEIVKLKKELGFEL